MAIEWIGSLGGRKSSVSILSLEPDWVSLLVGINDVASTTTPGTPVDTFRQTYSEVVKALADGVKNLIIMTPFYCPAEGMGNKLLDDYGAKRDIVIEVAQATDCVFIPLHEKMDELNAQIDSKLITKDAVHPTLMGAGYIADVWWKAVEGQEL